MNVMVTGGSGFIGQFLTGMLTDRGDRATVVSRTSRTAPTARVDVASWLPDLGQFDALVHLAGEPIFGKRWNAEQKENIRTSRVSSTRRIVDALAELPVESRPKVFVCGSAIGVYGDRGPELLGENALPGDDFLAGVCREWEAEAMRASHYGVRTVCLRTGIVLGAGGGALHKMLLPFKLGLGGPIGSGEQWMSWIHIRDLCGLILFAIDGDRIEGPLNGSAPGVVTNKDFTKRLAGVLGRPAFLPAPRLGLRLLLGESASVLTGSQRCDTTRALNAGYSFEFPELEPALRQILES